MHRTETKTEVGPVEAPILNGRFLTYPGSTHALPPEVFPGPRVVAGCGPYLRVVEIPTHEPSQDRRCL